MKKLLLIGLTFFQITHPLTLDELCDEVGSFLDPVLSKGELSVEHEKMFVEVAKSLGIEEKNVKARNFSTIVYVVQLLSMPFDVTVWKGYNGTVPSQLLNRVYLNEEWLNTLTDGEKRFAMAHALVWHKKDLDWKQYAVAFVAHILSIGINMEVQDRLKIINAQVVGEGLVSNYIFSRVVAQFSVWNLLLAQYSKKLLAEADEGAIMDAGVPCADGIEYLNKLYYPTRDQIENWPLYARVHLYIRNALLSALLLPGVREFCYWIPLEDRLHNIAALKSVHKKQFKKKNK